MSITPDLAATAPAEPVAPLATALAPGDTVGRYVVLSTLGRGGMGVVYGAYDPELDRRIAIKLLLPREGGASEEASARLLREAQAMARLNHPNIVAVHDVGRVGSAVYIAMEFVRGQTLGGWLDEKPRSRVEIFDAMLSAGDGLVAAHAAGLVHRDFKFDNVMIGDDGRVRVMDFGLVRKTGDSAELDEPHLVTIEQPLSKDLTSTGAVMGTPRFMSPEQFNGEAVDGRTDQFSFTVVLWEALFGTPCFEGSSFASLAIAVTQGRKAAPPPGKRVPRWVREILDRGLRTDPAERFASLDDLLAAMRRNPWRKRTAIASVSLLALGAGAGWAAGEVAERNAVADCASDAKVPDRVWNADRRQLLHESLGADEAADGMVDLVDSYAARWADVRESVCRQTRVEDTRTEALLKASTQCLDGRRVALAKLVDRLVDDPSEVAVEQAVSAATSLPAPDECADEQWLSQATPMPTDPAVRATASVLAEAHTLNSLGETTQALHKAAEADAMARAGNWLPQEARAGRTHGLLLVEVGRVEEGLARLRSAAVLGAFSGERQVAIDAQLTVMATLTNVLHKYDAAEAASETIGRALAGGTLARDTSLRADWEVAKGQLREEQGRYAEAAEAYRTGLALHIELRGPEHPAIAGIYISLGGLSLSRAQYEEAFDYMSKALVLTQNAAGGDPPTQALILSNLGVIARELRRYSAAEGFFHRAIAIDEAEFGADHPNVAYSLDGLGNLGLSRGDFGSGREHLERAVAIFEKGGEPLRGQLSMTAANLGRAHFLLEDHAKARTMLTRALALREEVFGPTSPKLATVLRDLAKVHVAEADFEPAVECLRRAVDVLEGAAEPSKSDLAVARRELEAAIAGVGV